MVYDKVTSTEGSKFDLYKLQLTSFCNFEKNHAGCENGMLGPIRRSIQLNSRADGKNKEIAKSSFYFTNNAVFNP